MRRSVLIVVLAVLCAVLPSAAQDRTVTLNPSGAAPGATVDITINVPFTANWGTVRFSPGDGMTVSNLRAAADGSGQTQFTLQIGGTVKPGTYSFIYEPRSRRLPAGMKAPLPYRGEFTVGKDFRSQRMSQLQARTGRTTTATREGTARSTLAQRNAGATRVGNQARDMMRVKWPSREVYSSLTAPRQQVYQQLFSAAVLRQTELYVWNGLCRPGTDCFGCADGPIFVDWNRLDVDWWFQAKITDTRAASAEWQVSWFPFPIGKNLTDPPGLLASGRLEKVTIGKDFWFQIDLTDYAPYPKGKRPSGGAYKAATTGTARAAVTKRIVGGSTAATARGKTAARVAFQDNLVVKASNSRSTTFGRMFPAARAVRKMPLPLRSAFYIRLILRDGQGAPVGVASRVVELDFGEPEAAKPFQFSPQGLGHPAVSFVRYEPVRPYAPDCMCWVKTLDDFKIMGNTVWPAGTLINSCAPKDEGFFDELGDVVGGFFGAIGDLVNYVAEIYNAAKSAVINAVVVALKNSGIGCGQECQFLITAAIDYGLTVCGLPPTLPSFKELTMMGTDYLAAQIAAQAGIPEDAAQEAARAFVNEVAFSNGSGSGGFRTIPDPNRQYRPAVVLLHVSAPPSGEGSLLIVRDRSGLYRDAEVPIPALGGFKDFDVPVALEPLEKPDAWMGLLPKPEDAAVNVGEYFNKQTQAQNALAAWTQKYTSGSFDLEVVTKANTGYWPHMKIRCSSNSTQADAEAWK